VPTVRSFVVEPVVPVLVAALRERGLLADVQVVPVCGEPDVRLVACREPGEVTVELLAAVAVDPAPSPWDAVQVRGEDRRVWQGPRHDAPVPDVVSFVEALLTGAEQVPYLRLG
jgi:hypothetical protein